VSDEQNKVNSFALVIAYCPMLATLPIQTVLLEEKSWCVSEVKMPVPKLVGGNFSAGQKIIGQELFFSQTRRASLIKLDETLGNNMNMTLFIIHQCDALISSGILSSSLCSR
jgi:hypothetical protein